MGGGSSNGTASCHWRHPGTCSHSTARHNAFHLLLLLLRCCRLLRPHRQTRLSIAATLCHRSTVPLTLVRCARCPTPAIAGRRTLQRTPSTKQRAF